MYHAAGTTTLVTGGTLAFTGASLSTDLWAIVAGTTLLFAGMAIKKIVPARRR
jgi:purine-cytosine permease-like protein